jgi:hypothetical protein
MAAFRCFYPIEFSSIRGRLVFTMSEIAITNRNVPPLRYHDTSMLKPLFLTSEFQIAKAFDGRDDSEPPLFGSRASSIRRGQRYDHGSIL